MRPRGGQLAAAISDLLPHYRMRDFGLSDWLNLYAFRRESMWLADA